jgi:hypothetical protein
MSFEPREDDVKAGIADATLHSLARLVAGGGDDMAAYAALLFAPSLLPPAFLSSGLTRGCHRNPAAPCPWRGRSISKESHSPRRRAVAEFLSQGQDEGKKR